MHVLYDKKVAKGTYRLGRILRVKKDERGVVRTVVVGLRKHDRREATMPYIPKPLEELPL